MNDHDGLGTACDLRSEQVWVEIPGIRLTIDHYGYRPRAHNCRGAGNNGEARQNYLVSGTDPQSRQRNFNGNAPVAHGHAMCTAHELREPSFKPFDEWTLRGNPARLDALRQIGPLITIKKRAVYRYHIYSNQISAFPAALP